ncbi:MAG: AAA family ATPase, partial [Mycobacteriaceae bacterium]
MIGTWAGNGSLPAERTPLLGRADVVAQALQLLLRERVRLLTLTGPGGVGKTRVALDVARKARAEFTDDLLFVPLGATHGAEHVAPAIARSLGFAETGERSALEMIERHLRERETLLVLDELEHVADAAPDVAQLLDACPGLTVLVSSRWTLRLSGETELVIEPLRTPPCSGIRLSPQEFIAFPAAALFVQRAQARRTDFRLDAQNIGAMAEICARLDGLPLAIELAAARVNLLEPPAILARMGSRLEFLTGGPRDLPERQRTLRDTIAWSYDLLTAAEQRLFRRLGCFIGGCTVDAAAAVTASVGDGSADPFEGVGALVDKSVLLRAETGGESRLSMLEVVREYATDRLVAAEETAAVAHAHAHFYLDLAARAEQQLRGAEQGRWLARLDDERGNLSAAMRYFLNGRQPAVAARLACSLGRFWYARGGLAEGRRWLEEALAAGVDDAGCRARALRSTSMLASYLGDLQRADELAQQALAIAREQTELPEIANALVAVGFAAVTRGCYVESIRAYEESVAILRELDDGVQLGEVLGQLSVSMVLHNDLTGARAAGEESLTLVRRHAAAEVVAYSLAVVRGAPLYAGSDSVARRLLGDTLSAAKDVGDRRLTSRALLGLGLIELRNDRCGAARSLLEEATAIASESGDRWFLIGCLQELATAHHREGRPRQVVILLSAAEALREETGVPLPPYLRGDHERMVAAARGLLSVEDFAALWANGRHNPLEESLDAACDAASTDPAV